MSGFKKKLTSRKFWMAVAGSVGLVLTDYSMTGAIRESVLVSAAGLLAAGIYTLMRVDEQEAKNRGAEGGE